MKKLLTLSLLLALCLPLAGQAETLTINSDMLKLHIDLPENWVQAEDPSKYVFLSPDGDGAIMIAPSDIPVTPELVESITPDFVWEWMLGESDGEFADVQQLMFAKAVDDTGNLYAISSYGVTSEGIPLIYAHYFYSAADGTMVSVSGISVNNDAGLPVRNWFDQLLLTTVPEHIIAELAAQM